jgi:hypothetical protein
MAGQSKIATQPPAGFVEIIKNALIGTNQKKVFSAILLAIIGYLIYMKNKKSSTDTIKIDEKKLNQKVFAAIF